MTPKRQKRLMEQIRRSRARLMVSDPAVAMVLMYLYFVATKDVWRISTNGRVILFDPDWFQMLGKKETDYILSHVVIHIVLEDVKRPAFFSGDRFHHACDIIAGSVLRDRGWSDDALPNIGRLKHKTYYTTRNLPLFWLLKDGESRASCEKNIRARYWKDEFVSGKYRFLMYSQWYDDPRKGATKENFIKWYELL